MYFRNLQTLGSLQQAPQLTHAPLRSLETGRGEVRVLLILVVQVLSVVVAIVFDQLDPLMGIGTIVIAGR